MSNRQVRFYLRRTKFLHKILLDVSLLFKDTLIRIWINHFVFCSQAEARQTFTSKTLMLCEVFVESVWKTIKLLKISNQICVSEIIC